MPGALAISVADAHWDFSSRTCAELIEAGRPLVDASGLDIARTVSASITRTGIG